MRSVVLPLAVTYILPLAVTYFFSAAHVGSMPGTVSAGAAVSRLGPIRV